MIFVDHDLLSLASRCSRTYYRFCRSSRMGKDGASQSGLL
jgi:hypothetical protein